MYNVFVRTNNKQILGAMLAKYAILRKMSELNQVNVRFINVDEIPLFHNFQGKKFKRYRTTLTYALNDLQSFTLAAFMAPELTGYQGRAMVIDPDVFALTDVSALFERDLKGKALAARPKRGAWDTSVMMLDCAKLTHWKMKDILTSLGEFKTSYEDWMSLKHEQVDDLEPEWNSWDLLTPTSKCLHTTNRLTQPWKTGLKIDFTRERQLDKYLGIIPKPWVLRLFGRWPTRYQSHPDKNIEQFFFQLLRDALNAGAITKAQIQKEIANKHVRSDTFNMLSQL